MTVNSDCKENIELLKNNLRAANKQLRKETFSKENNSLILKNLQDTDVYKKSQRIMAFFPLPYEVDLRELFIKNADEKEWFLPKFCDCKMFPCRFEGESSLITGRFNIQEPSGNEAISPDKLDLILLPALAADLSGNRLGYGKGCYDKFLSSADIKATLLLPIRDNLIVKTVPAESYDIKAHIILSEKRIIKIR